MINKLVFESDKYTHKSDLAAQRIFSQYKMEGTIQGDYDDDKWTIIQDNRRINIPFSFSKGNSLMDRLGITDEEFIKRLKAFVAHRELSYYRAYTIVMHVNFLKKVFSDESQKDMLTDVTRAMAVDRFLDYLDVNKRDGYKNHVKIKKFKGEKRKMSHLMVYLLLIDAVEKLYDSPIDDDTFVEFFPVYFWVVVTFRLPLRVQETLYTPLDCIHKDADGYALQLRRSKIKGSAAHKNKVHYNIDDYQACDYNIPYTSLITNIQKYRKLTKHIKRKFLLVPNSENSSSLLYKDLRKKIDEFLRIYVVNNHDYDFARFVAGDIDIEVRPGDSRVIALSNLFSQGVSADQCRQLAGHASEITSEHYFSNTLDTLWCSAVVAIQKKMSKKESDISDAKKYLASASTIDTDTYCVNPVRITDPENIQYCIANGHISDCMGCKYYIYTQQSLEKYIEREEQNIKDAVQSLQKAVKDMNDPAALNRAALAYQTSCARYTQAVKKQMEGVYKEWDDHKDSIQTD